MIILICKIFTNYIYPTKSQFQIRGIDISHHQGIINWNELKKNENIDFIFIKATEGSDFIDENFRNNWENAKLNKYKVGAYHFYRECKTGKEQAENFINIVPKEKGNLPPVVDLEFSGNCNSEKTDEKIILEIQDCLNILENYYEQKPIIYTTSEFYEKYLINKFLGYSIWFRKIYLKPKLKDKRNWIFWQYSNIGKISGIEGFIDLNVFNGNIEDFEKLLK